MVPKKILRKYKIFISQLQILCFLVKIYFNQAQKCGVEMEDGDNFNCNIHTKVVSFDVLPHFSAVPFARYAVVNANKVHVMYVPSYYY